MLSFFSMFDADNDSFRVRQLVATDDTSVTPAPPIDDYDILSDRPDDVIRTWIDAQLALTSCLVVLIGQHTASQRWVTYAIGRARILQKPMIGVAIDKLADADGNQGVAGSNPFANSGMPARALSALEIYDPPFATSVFARAHIRYGLPEWVELAVREDRWRGDSRVGRHVRRSEHGRHEDAS
ncbi:TIR domain-containing protein [Agreia sp.]|uniref:TIR domain-containing protein n=1 Tax=Agreia sp. TaxID=1872416 RepID=UPI0035BC8769